MENVTVVCDFRVDPDAHCGEAATGLVSAQVGLHTLSADLCDKHLSVVQAELTTLGLSPVSASVGRKRRHSYVTRSGQMFTTSDAREWLLANGHIENERGRVPTEKLDLYAATH